MINIAICDDNADACRYTASLVEREMRAYAFETEIFSDTKALIDAISKAGYSPDIAILDIMIGEESGIALARQLKRQLPSCGIIFLTGYADYAPESFETEPVWFITKSTAETYLGPALQRAIERADSWKGRLGIVARSGGKRFFLPLNEVLYLDRFARRTRIVCRDGSYEISGRVESLLGDEVREYFIRCHQGYWVNLRHIAGLEKEEFVLTDGSRVPISRTYRDEARRRFFESISTDHN